MGRIHVHLHVHVLILVLVLVLVLQPSNGKRIDRLRFRQDGSFKVSVFGDLHYGENSSGPWGPEQDANSTRAMRAVLQYEDPDLVVLNGDLITGENIIDNATAYWEIMLRPMRELGYRWATVFGNHDGISPGLRGTRQDLLDVDMSFELSMTQRGPENIHGIGNFIIPVYPHVEREGEEPISVLYFFDSGGDRNQPEYIIWEDQVAWYVQNSREFRGSSPKPKPSFAFFHIPLIQYLYAYDKEKCFGMQEDGAGGQYRDSGLLDAFENEGDVRAVFVSHDHGNSWCCPYQGVQLCFGRRTGYGGYGTWQQGTRVISMQESDPDNFKLYVRLETGEILP